jgi:hypothetical protein
VGKAIILELADLNYVDKEIFERSMKEHLPKKVIIQTIEKGLLLPDKIDRRGGACRINKDELFSLTEKLRKDVRSLETKRQDGLYVQIRIEDGTVEKSPLNLNKNDVEQFMEVVAKSIEFGKRLCEFFNDYKSPDSKINVRNNLWMFSNKSGFSIQWDEA